MPIYNNNEYVDLNAEKLSKDAEKVLKEIELIRETYKGRWPLTFKQKRYLKGASGKMINKASVKSVYTPTSIRYAAEAPGTNGRTIWIYSVSGPIKEENNKIRYTKLSEKITSSGLRVFEEDIDKAWFIMYKCPSFLNGRIILEDKTRDADIKANKKQAEVDAMAILWGTNSPIKDKKLKTVGRAWGIPGLSGLTDNQIRAELDTLLEKKFKEDQHVYQKFVASTEINEDMKIKANIALAQEKQIILLNPIDHTAEWVVKQGSPRDVFYHFRHDEFNDMLGGLVFFCKEEGKSIYRSILASIGEKEDSVIIDLSLKEIDNKAYHKQIYAFAEQNKIRTKPRKFEEVEKEVLSIYQK